MIFSLGELIDIFPGHAVYVGNNAQSFVSQIMNAVVVLIGECVFGIYFDFISKIGMKLLELLYKVNNFAGVTIDDDNIFFFGTVFPAAFNQVTALFYRFTGRIRAFCGAGVRLGVRVGFWTFSTDEQPAMLRHRNAATSRRIGLFILKAPFAFRLNYGTALTHISIMC